MVYILDVDGNPLMPTNRHGKVRKMLNDGRAKVVNRSPFTIQLQYESKRYTQPVTLGVDTSNRKIGLSAATEKQEVYTAEVELRKDVSKLVEQRKQLRGRRRYRKDNRCPRHNERRRLKPYIILEGIKLKKKYKNRLKVSSEQKIQSHLNAIKRVHDILPITKVVIETFQVNPGKVFKLNFEEDAYKKSKLRASTLIRDNYTCQMCGGSSKDYILTVKPFNMTLRIPNYNFNEIDYEDKVCFSTLCKTCRDELELLEESKKHVKWGSRPLNAAYAKIYNETSRIDKFKIGRMRLLVYERARKIYPNVEYIEGAQTKQERIDSGLKNNPRNNARAIVGNIENFTDGYYYYKLRRCHNRQIHKATPNKSGVRPEAQSPYYTKGFSSYDLVRYNGELYYITKKRRTGYFGLGNVFGETLINSVKYDKLELVKRAKSYSVELI